MAKPFTALHDDVIPYLPGAAVPIIDSAIRKATREFLRRTTVLRQEFTFTTTPGADTYRLTPAFGQVSSVLGVYEAGVDRPLPVATEHARHAGAVTQTAWQSPTPNVLRILPVPAEPKEFRVEAVITLGFEDTEFPDDIFENYSEALALGTLSVMYSMPGKPWTSADAARSAGRGFGNEIRRVRSLLRDGGQPNASTLTATFKFGR